MKLDALKKTWAATASENRTMRMTNAVLVVIVGLLVIALLLEDRTVVMVPPEITDAAWISSDRASPEMQTAQALFLTQLIANVTPRTAEFLSEALPPHLASGAYHTIMDTLRDEIEYVRDEQLTVEFLPTDVSFDAQKNVVMVTGQQITRGVRGATSRSIKTYEYGFVTHAHRLYVNHFVVSEKRKEVS